MYLGPHTIFILQEMHRHLVWQTDKLLAFEKELSEIREQLNNHTNARTQNIEKIEYNFEQLKVDTLAGTLIIGISPYDSGQIKELSMMHQTTENVHLGDAPQGELFPHISEQMKQYLRDEAADEIRRIAGSMQHELDDDEIKAMIEDLERQVDARIIYYIKTMKKTEQYDPTLEPDVIRMVKHDIATGIEIYLQNKRRDAGV